MHTLDTAICLTVVFVILAVLFLSVPGLYRDVRDVSVASATADVLRSERSQLLMIRKTGPEPGLTVVAATPEMIWEWTGLADDAYPLIKDACRLVLDHLRESNE